MPLGQDVFIFVERSEMLKSLGSGVEERGREDVFVAKFKVGIYRCIGEGARMCL